MPTWAEPYLTAAHPAFYPMIFLLILMAGLGAMVSADFVILTVGYVLYTGKAEFLPSMIAIWAGILLSDTGMFFIGGKFGLRLTRIWPFRKILTPERIARAEIGYRKHGYRIVFAARFMPGIRTVFMFTSGLLGLRYWKFIAHDAAGALIVAPITLLSVSWVAGNIQAILPLMQRLQWVIVSALVVSATIWALRKRSRRASEPASTETLQTVAARAVAIKASARTESDPACPRD